MRAGSIQEVYSHVATSIEQLCMVFRMWTFPLALCEHLSLGVANTLHWCFAIVGSMLMKNTTHSYHTHFL